MIRIIVMFYLSYQYTSAIYDNSLSAVMLRCKDIVLKLTHSYTDVIIKCINHVDNR